MKAQWKCVLGLFIKTVKRSLFLVSTCKINLSLWARDTIIVISQVLGTTTIYWWGQEKIDSKKKLNYIMTRNTAYASLLPTIQRWSSSISTNLLNKRVKSLRHKIYSLIHLQDRIDMKRSSKQKFSLYEKQKKTRNLS